MMNNTETTISPLELAKAKFGFNKLDSCWLIPGADLLRYVNMEVILIKYEKTETGFENSTQSVLINSITDFETENNTYLLNFSPSNAPDENEEVRVMPEGFSFGGVEDTRLYRFIPLSLHFKIMEEEAWFGKLPIIYAKAKSIELDVLKEINRLKSEPKINYLNYFRNVTAVIKAADNTMLCFRVAKLKLSNIVDDEYTLELSPTTESDGETYIANITKDMKEYPFIVKGETVGTLKLVDLQDSRW